MLLPQELKNYKFRHSMNGYAPGEVDEHIEFIVSKYEALYRENSELAHKLAIALKSLDELRSREKQVAELEKILTAATAQASADAEKKKEEIIRSAVEEADRITAEAEQYVASQEKVFRRLQKDVSALRDTLYAAYSEHIDRVEQLVAISAGETFSAPKEAPAALDKIAQEIPTAYEKAETAAEAKTPPDTAEADMYATADMTDPFTEEGNENTEAEDNTENGTLLIDPFVPSENTDTEDAETDTYATADMTAPYEEQTNTADEDLYSDEELFEEAEEPVAEPISLKFTVSDEDTYSEEELTEDDLFVKEPPLSHTEIDFDDLLAEISDGDVSASDTDTEDEDALLLKELHDTFVNSFDAPKEETVADDAALPEDDIMKALAEAIEEKPAKTDKEPAEADGNPFAFLFEEE